MVSVNKIGIFLSFFSVQIIDQVYGDATDIGEILWHTEKY